MLVSDPDELCALMDDPKLEWVGMPEPLDYDTGLVLVRYKLVDDFVEEHDSSNIGGC